MVTVGVKTWQSVCKNMSCDHNNPDQSYSLQMNITYILILVILAT